MQKNPFDPGYYGSEELRDMGFNAVGEDVMIAKDCTIIGLHNISIGHNVRIDGRTTIAARRGRCSLGSYIHIGGGCHLSCVTEVVLEDFVGLSQGVRLYSASDDYSGRSLTNPTVPVEFQNVVTAPVRLGRHVIVGAGSVILPGVNIEEGASIGALSLVSKSLPPWGVYSGVPARRLKERHKDLLKAETLLWEGRDKPHGPL